MNQAFAQMLAAFELALRLSLPAFGVAFGVAVAIALLQAWSRLAEPALNAIPRALLTWLALGSAGGWMAREQLTYPSGLFRARPELVR